MVGEAIGSSLPAALAVALTPFPMIAIAIILTGAQGKRAGTSFTLGWVLGLTAIAVIGVLLFEEAYETEEATGNTGYVIKIAVGVALMLFGVKKGIGKLRATGAKEPPGWLTALSDVSDLKAFGVALLNAVNPKVVVLMAAAVNAIVQTGVEGGGLVAATIVLVAVASSTVVALLLFALLGGPSSRTYLERTRAFMLTNTDVIVAVVMLLLGVSVLGDGLSGIGT